MNVLLAVFILSTTLIIGFCLAQLLHVKNFFEKLGLAGLFGTFITTMIVFLVHWLFHYEFTASMLLITLSVLVFLFLYPVRKLVSLKMAINLLRYITSLKSKVSFTETVLLSVLSFVIIGSFVQNIFWPVLDWDAIALYDFRGRVVAETGSFVSGIELGYYFQYPPYTSLLHTFMYVVEFEQVKIWYSVVYSSFLLVFYSMVRNYSSRVVSLVATLLVAINPYFAEHSIMAYTNLPYAIYLSLGILYLLQWIYKQDEHFGIIGGILIASSIWVRMAEPFWMVSLLLSLVAIYLSKKKKRTILTALFIILLIYGVKQVWPSFVDNLLSSNTISSSDPTTILVETTNDKPRLSKLTSIVSNSLMLPYIKKLGTYSYAELLSNISLVNNYFVSYIYPVFRIYIIPLIIVAMYDLIRNFKKEWLNWAVVISCIAMIYLGTLLFSLTLPIWKHIGGSATRMSIFLLPLVVYLLGKSSIWKNIK